MPERDVEDKESQFQRARWPNECQVLSGRILHIDYSPKHHEPYYRVTGKEARPKPVSGKEGTTVYNYMPLSSADYRKLNTRVDKVRLYGRNGDEFHHVRNPRDCEFWGEYASNEIRERNMIVGREVQRSIDYLKYRNCVSRVRERKCDFCEAKINPDYNRFIDIMHSITNHKNPVARQNETEVAADACWCRNKAKFSRNNVDGSKYLLATLPENLDHNDLIFESRFESGNLVKAVKMTDEHYELYLRPDIYTNKCTQWFYFEVKNMKTKIPYRFSIVNLTKPDSLYKEGMRPLMYSTVNAMNKNIGWQRCGDNISLFKNGENLIYVKSKHGRQGLAEDFDDGSGNNFTLTFEVEFQNENDTVYFAHSYPYTYSNLQHYLMNVEQNQVKSKYCKLGVLCHSLAGNNIYCLTVTEAPSLEERRQKRKKAMVITSRVHPGESPSSWMMKGFMDFITGSSPVAERLRHEFVFKIVPMLNPDGVIVGNTRCSLSGYDLNRQYLSVTREAYPSIWSTKAMIKRLIEERGVTFYCDMHAHSWKHNIFIYGCENLKRHQDRRLLEQVFPMMLHKKANDKFSFADCEFQVQKNKTGTGRVVMWGLGVTNSFTLEASFAGSTMEGRDGTHFSIKDYEELGAKFCETLMDYYDVDPYKSKYHLAIYNELRCFNKRYRRRFDETEAYLRHRERIRERELREKLRKEGKLEEYLREKGKFTAEPEIVQPITVDLDIQRYNETKKVGLEEELPNKVVFTVDKEKLEKIITQMRRKKSLKIEEYREDEELPHDISEFRPKLAGKTGLPTFFFSNLVKQNRSAFQKSDARACRNRNVKNSN